MKIQGKTVILSDGIAVNSKGDGSGRKSLKNKKKAAREKRRAQKKKR